VFKKMSHATLGSGFKNAAGSAPEINAYQRRVG